MGSVYTVSQINGYIKNIFVKDMLLNRVSVQGEVSNCKYHTSGHIYFTLKDKGGQIPCVMFLAQRSHLTFQLREGQKVVVSGQISVYERDGRYQMYASDIVLDGVGQLYEQLELCKKKLLAEGLFDPKHKKKIPAYPKRIGVVTASTGAALQDIRNISARRNPYIQLILAPSKVQGIGAAESVVHNIKRLDRMGVDIIIVARGGGSIEDLWAFNEEIVARAVYECETPIISGVGHETDETLIDYVSDLRAPTPSAAAELAVYEFHKLDESLAGYHAEIVKMMMDKIEEARAKTENKRMKLALKHPRNKLNENRQRLADVENAYRSVMQKKIGEQRAKVPQQAELTAKFRLVLAKRQQRLAVAAERLNGMSPLQRISKGYAYVTDEKNRKLSSVGQIQPGDKLLVTMKDGTVTAVAEEISSKE